MDHEHKERSRGGLQCDLGHPPERGGVFDRNIREGNMAASPYPLTGARTRTWAQKTYSEHTTIRPTTQQRLRSDDPAVFLETSGETLREAFDRVAATMVIVIPQLNTAGHFRVRRLRAPKAARAARGRCWQHTA